MKYIIICYILLFPSLLMGQKWERWTKLYERHYEGQRYQKALNYALKSLEYSYEKMDSVDKRFILSNYHTAIACFSLKEYMQARSYIQLAYKLQLAEYSDQGGFGEICELFGRIELALGQINSAERLLKNSREIKLAMDGIESYGYVQSLYYLAELEMARSGWQQMAGLLEQGLDIHGRLFTKNREYVLYTNYLGLIYLNSQVYQKAAFHFLNVINAYVELGWEKDATYAEACNNMGLVYYYQYDFDQAEDYYLRADTVFRSIQEGYSANYAMLINNVASLYQTWNKMDKAASYYRLLEAYFDANNVAPDLQFINSMENMASFYSVNGNYDQAERGFRKALAMRQLVNPADSLNMARSNMSLATIQFYKQDFQAAASSIEGALEVLREVLPSGHHELLNALNFVGSVYYEMFQYRNAVRYHREVLSKVDTAGQVSITLDAYLGLAKAFLGMARYDSAEIYVKRCLDVAERYGFERNQYYLVSLQLASRMYSGSIYFENALDNGKLILMKGCWRKYGRPQHSTEQTR